MDKFQTTNEVWVKKKWNKRGLATAIFIVLGLIVLVSASFVVIPIISNSSDDEGGEYHKVGSIIKISEDGKSGYLNVKIEDISKRDSYYEEGKEVKVKINIECVGECPGFDPYDVRAYNNFEYSQNNQEYYLDFEYSIYGKLSSTRLILSPGENYQTYFTIYPIQSGKKYIVVDLGGQFKMKI